MEKKEKQGLISYIVLYSILILGLLAYWYFYISPNYNKIFQDIDLLNKLNKETDDIKKFWIDAKTLKKFLSNDQSDNQNNKNLFELLKDEENINSIITKPWDYSWSYLEWIQEEMLKEHNFDKEIERNNKIIWSIIPTFLDENKYKIFNKSTNLMIWRKLSLDNFVSYVEEKIIKKFNLDTYSTIGIDNISFDETKNNDINIGSFKLSIDFKWKNSDIIGLLQQIHQSWKLDISNEGKLISNVYLLDEKELSENLLVTIDDIKLAKFLQNDDKLNNGTIVLRFYVRWIWFDEFIQIKNKISKKYEWLLSNITKNSKLCDKWSNSFCKNSNWSKAIATIKWLNSELNLIKSKIEEINKKTKIENISADMDNLFKIYLSLNSIEFKYNKNISIINELMWTWVK